MIVKGALTTYILLWRLQIAGDFSFRFINIRCCAILLNYTCMLFLDIIFNFLGSSMCIRLFPCKHFSFIFKIYLKFILKI